MGTVQGVQNGAGTVLEVGTAAGLGDITCVLQIQFSRSFLF